MDSQIIVLSQCAGGDRAKQKARVAVARHQQLLQISRARMQPLKRMKTLKQEDGQGGALCSPAAQEKDGDGGPADEGAHATLDTPSQIVSLKVHFETQAAAIQLLERTEVMGCELQQARAEIVELKADIRLKASALQAQDALSQASLQPKDAVILVKDEEIQRLQSWSAWRPRLAAALILLQQLQQQHEPL